MESPSKHFYFMTSVDVSDSESALNEDQSGESGKTRKEGVEVKFKGKSLFNENDVYDNYDSQMSPVDDVTLAGDEETSDLFSDTESTIAWENTNLEFPGSVAEFPRTSNNNKKKEYHGHSESVHMKCGNDNKQFGVESDGRVVYNGQDLEQENRISKSGFSRSVVSDMSGVCNSTPVSCFSVSKQDKRGTGRRNDCPEERPPKCSNRSNCRASKKLGRNSLRTKKDGVMKDETPVKHGEVDPVRLGGSRPDFVVIDIPRYSDFCDLGGPVPNHPPQMIVHHQRGRARTNLVESSRDVYVDFDKYAAIQQKIPHRRVDLFSDGESSGGSTESATVARNENQTSNLDQIWDEYQDPLYPTVSDSTGEEKLDATGLVGDWQDHVIDDDVFVYQCDAKRRTNSVKHNVRTNFVTKHNVPEDPLESSDTDVGEMAEFMGDSRTALRLTRKSVDQLERQAADKNDVKYNEPRATCRTSINCIETLLDALIHRSLNHSRSSDLHRSSENVGSDDVQKLSKLLKRWKTLLRRLDHGSNRNLQTKDGAKNDGARIQDSAEETQLFPTISSGSNELCRRGTSNIPDELIRTNSKEDQLEPHPVENVQSAKRPEESIGLPLRILIIVVALLSIYFILVRYFVNDISTFHIIPHLKYIKGPPPF